MLVGEKGGSDRSQEGEKKYWATIYKWKAKKKKTLLSNVRAKLN